MIQIDRKQYRTPSQFGTSKFRSARSNLESHYKKPEEYRLQKRFEPKLPLEKLLPLNDVLPTFAGKCAFCETLLSSKDGRVGYYRPVNQALGEPEDLWEGYWWLTYEWFNIYAICRECARNKGVHFPVRGKRGRVPQKHRALLNEAPLLLDPCYDNPEIFLNYKETGEVFAIGEMSERGKATIDILKLNRPRLVSRRKTEASKLEKRLRSGDASVMDEVGRELPFAGFRRSIVRNYVIANNLEEGWRKWDPDDLLGLVSNREHFVVAREESVQTAVADNREVKSEPKVEIVSNVTSSKVKVDLSLNVFIDRVVIRNFKCIERLDLSLPQADSADARWKMLLGENGSGKSSVLQAVALALMDSHERRKVFDSGELVAEKLLRFKTKSGSVKVYLSHSPEPIGFEMKRDAKNLVKVNFVADVFVHGPVVRAFGATRIGRRSREGALPNSYRAEVENLFNPFRTLRDAEEFISALDPDNWKRAVRTLRDLIQLDSDDFLEREGDEVFIDRGTGEDENKYREYYADLSEGYRSLLTMACDIVSGIPEGYSDFTDAPGIILIDEIGNHLHPRWKMRIGDVLRRSFPAMQFLVTTHEPLCLRGLKKGETTVMVRDALTKSVRIITESLPAPASMRIDQLLTSEHFGLSTTIDPEIDAKFQQYYSLLAKPKRSDGENELVSSLRKELSNEGAFNAVLGYTRRDQAIYDAVDAMLAGRMAAKTKNERNRVDREGRKTIANLWRDVVAAAK